MKPAQFLRPLPDRRTLNGRLTRLISGAFSRLHPATGGCGICWHRPLPLSLRLAPAPNPAFPVDIVYTWVDGTDPEHSARRALYLPEHQHAAHKDGLLRGRFRDNEELRYSLRALELYAPWANRVIIVTDRQKPNWLNANHPKIRIVDHTECIPEAYLPTFNSHVIEAHLHRIEGLSEHYIYINDDIFLGRPCEKSHFFMANGLPLAYVDWRARRVFGYRFTKTPHALSYFNTLALLRERGIATDPGFVTAHGPFAQTRSNARDTYSFFEAELQTFCHNRFRTTAEMAFYCHALPLLQYSKKRLVPCDECYYYVQARRHDRIAYYKAILQSRREGAAPLFFCINDAGKSTSPRWREDLRQLLASYYPTPSQFEKG